MPFAASSGGDTIGYAFKVTASGSQGNIVMIVGVDTDLTVTGVSIVNNSETKGIGSNAANDTFLAQFNGMDGTKNIVMNQDFDAYSGATISSTALFAAINDCINCFNELA
mgnify:CR=1 FL=1